MGVGNYTWILMISSSLVYFSNVYNKFEFKLKSNYKNIVDNSEY